MIANDGVSTQQIVQLSTAKAKQAQALEAKISKLLSGDSDVDAYALLSMIKNNYIMTKVRHVLEFLEVRIVLLWPYI